MSKSLELLTLRANAPQFDPAQGEAGLPKRILVLGWGAHETTKGLVVCNETTMRELLAFNAAQNWDRPYLDYEHNTIPGSPTYQGEPCDIAGRSDCLQLVSGEGVYFEMPALSNWTESGKKNALAGNYPDLSPVVKVNERNEVIGLHSAALCRHGATPGLVFLSAAPVGKNGSLKPAAPTSSKRSMQKQPPQTNDELAAALIELLGLDAATPPADLMTAIGDKLAKAAAPAEGEDKMLSSPAFLELKAKQEAQETQLKLLSSGLDADKRAGIIREATRAGKAVPASVAKTLPLDDLVKLCAELPVTLPMEKRTTTEEALMLSSGFNTESPDAAAVSRATGVSDEDRKKYAGR